MGLIDNGWLVKENGAMSKKGLSESLMYSAVVVEPALSLKDAQDLAVIFKALGEPNRVRLLSLVVTSDTEETCLCDLTERVGLSQPTVSHHMKILVNAGLVSREQRGRWAYYRPTTEGLIRAAQVLSRAEVGIVQTDLPV